MKRIFTLLVLFATVAVSQTYRTVSIAQIQTVPMDSLKLADSLGIGSTRFRLQTSPFFGSTIPPAVVRETVQVVALVAVPPKVITYTGGGRTLALVDTGAAGSLPWTGLFVRYPGDSSQADADNMYSIEKGDIIRITGYVDEFPLNNMNSISQFVPLVGKFIDILSSGNPIPAPYRTSITTFNKGANPGGKVMFSTGEPYEAKQVEFTNLTVVAQLNTARGTWVVSDAEGNTLSMYDWSYYFTIGHGSVVTPGDPNYKVPPVGTKIDTLRGYIATSSGSESNRGYRICPIWPSDVVYGKIAPGLTTHRRNPVIVGKDSQAVITAKVYKQTSAVVSGAPLASQQLVYSVNNGAWQTVNMSAPGASDSISSGTIPAQAPGSTVRYFVRVADTDNQVTLLANSGALTQYDSSKGFFFYTVVDRSTKPVLAPSDIQATAYINGRSPYVGAIDSVGGVITADTSALRISPLTAAGANAWYIQSGTAPFSGLWLTGPDSIMTKFKMGDSVVVTGTIQENFDVTRLGNITKGRVVTSGKPIPAPLKFKTERFGDAASNGNLDAEPYEGMLVRFDSVTVTAIDPVFAEPTEYWISNSSQAILVRRDGRNTYSNQLADTAVGMTIVKVGNKFASVTGVLYYSNGRYKVAPRTNADYVGFNPNSIRRTNTVASEYALEQNYPNPFNPSTTVRYSIPMEGMVSVKVFNIVGQEVATLVNDVQSAGTYSVTFDASTLASGMYLYRISSGGYTQVRKMLLLK
ncbi:MAG: T9SS type A sorting domain-containing protein [Bacteroidetes bacterium]|nr:T9SS type A sorting domain-containing protein [Bacteroidota bacterium]